MSAQSLQRRLVSRLTLVLIVLVPIAVILLCATSARATNVTYCSDQPRTDSDPNCTYPPGNESDPCNSETGHHYGSWGGWFENYYDTYQDGKYPYGILYAITYPSGCSAEDVCIYMNAELHHQNDTGCVSTYSWGPGFDVDLAVGNYGTSNTWYIYGTGYYP